VGNGTNSAGGDDRTVGNDADGAIELTSTAMNHESITALADRIRKEAPAVRRMVVDQPELIKPLADWIPDEHKYLNRAYIERLEADQNKSDRDAWLAWAHRYIRLLDVIKGLYAVPA
jgi:hypothetical protein